MAIKAEKSPLEEVGNGLAGCVLGPIVEVLGSAHWSIEPLEKAYEDDGMSPGWAWWGPLGIGLVRTFGVWLIHSEVLSRLPTNCRTYDSSSCDQTLQTIGAIFTVMQIANWVDSGTAVLRSWGREIERGAVKN